MLQKILKLLKLTIPEYFKEKYRFYISQTVRSALKELLLANIGNKTSLEIRAPKLSFETF